MRKKSKIAKTSDAHVFETLDVSKNIFAIPNNVYFNHNTDNVLATYALGSVQKHSKMK